MNKEIFLESIYNERKQWTSLLEQVGESRMTISNALSEWSVKDLIAHIMAYEQFVTDYLTAETESAGYKPSATPEELAQFLDKFGYPDFGSPLLDDDGPNAWVVAHYRNHTLGDVITKEEQVFAKLFQRIESLSEEQLTPYYETIANNTFVHYGEHAIDVARWLNR